MAHEATGDSPASLIARIAALEKENENLRGQLMLRESDERMESEAGSAQLQQRSVDLSASRAETSKAQAELRRAEAKIERTEARQQRDREHDRAELASAEGIIAALESVQLAARDGEARIPGRRKHMRTPYFSRKELPRLVRDAMREAVKPLTATEIVAHAIAAKGLAACQPPCAHIKGGRSAEKDQTEFLQIYSVHGPCALRGAQ
ncbi:MAG TPA: hypothetical protein VGF97_15500 [Rhizomicrobium sp.]|jgi:hypothetical protein